MLTQGPARAQSLGVTTKVPLNPPDYVRETRVRLINICTYGDYPLTAPVSRFRPMHENDKDDEHTMPLTERRWNAAGHQPAGLEERRTMNRWRFRADQIQLLYRQIQTELIIGILVATVVSIVFWNHTPPALLLGWTIAIIMSTGIRSLFISGNNIEDNINEFNVWGKRYVVGVFVSGTCWGILGILSARYGTLTHQIFSLVVLSGISLTAYVSMQSSPITVAAFIIPALLPATAWFVYQTGTIQYALSTLIIIFASVMLFSSRTMRTILTKSFSLGSHNTELIKKLITTREAAEKAKTYAEQINRELNKHINERKLAEERIRSSEPVSYTHLRAHETRR